nr:MULTISPECIES: hypothetical protein [unclassified Bradyrhizobium]
METVRRLRAMASLCRQSAAYHPDRNWNLLAEAEYWEHLANGQLVSRPLRSRIERERTGKRMR